MSSEPGLSAAWIPLGVLSRWIDEVIALEAALHRLFGTSVVGPWAGDDRALVAALAEEHGQHALSWFELRPDRFDEPAAHEAGRVARLVEALDRAHPPASRGRPAAPVPPPEPVGSSEPAGPGAVPETSEPVSPTRVRAAGAAVVAGLIGAYEAVAEASVCDPVVARQARRLAREERAGLAELTEGRVALPGGARPDPRAVVDLLVGADERARPEAGSLEEVLDLLEVSDGLRPIGLGTWLTRAPERRALPG